MLKHLAVTLALSRDYETSNSPDPQEGRAEVSCPDFKRAESAESAEDDASEDEHEQVQEGGRESARLQTAPKEKEDEAERIEQAACSTPPAGRSVVEVSGSGPPRPPGLRAPENKI